MLGRLEPGDIEIIVKRILESLCVESVTLRRTIRDREYNPKVASIEYTPEEIVEKFEKVYWSATRNQPR